MNPKLNTVGAYERLLMALIWFLVSLPLLQRNRRSSECFRRSQRTCTSEMRRLPLDNVEVYG